jgi:hypothetical protein
MANEATGTACLRKSTAVKFYLWFSAFFVLLYVSGTGEQYGYYYPLLFSYFSFFQYLFIFQIFFPLSL